MQVFVNDEPMNLPVPATVATLLDAQFCNREGLAVAVNQQIINRQLWPKCQLRPDDQVAVFAVVAGG